MNQLFQRPLVNHGRQEPGRKARTENDRQGKSFFKAKEGDKEEQDAGQHTPESPFGKTRHDVRVALVFQIHPGQNQGPGQRYDADQTGGGGESLGGERSQENNSHAERDLDQKLHRVI